MEYKWKTEMGQYTQHDPIFVKKKKKWYIHIEKFWGKKNQNINSR